MEDSREAWRSQMPWPDWKALHRLAVCQPLGRLALLSCPPNFLCPLPPHRVGITDTWNRLLCLLSDVRRQEQSFYYSLDMLTLPWTVDGLSGYAFGAIEYSNLTLAPGAVLPGASWASLTVTVCAELTNKASVPTEEVVQVYGQPQPDVEGASVPRALLLGFTRTPLLDVDDIRFTCIDFPLGTLRLMDVQGEKFTVLAGIYKLSIGGGGPGPQGVGLKALPLLEKNLTIY
eukprot:SAG31_NODE_6419_length_2027_cov_1.037344_1_plen_231_part_00